ncbi:Golgi transport complex subunit 3 [Phlyctochytrium planicorne]|nr:Golgi transport complex subunit 3 [Phlyctochytrium planicorne]
MSSNVQSPKPRPNQPQAASPHIQPLPHVTPRPVIDYNDWEAKTFAILTEAQKDSILRLSDLCVDHVPFPTDLFPDEADTPEPRNHQRTVSTNSLKVRKGITPLTDVAAKAAEGESKKISPFELADPINSTQEFLTWFVDIQEEMEKSREDVYRSHLEMLSAYLARCDDIMKDVEGTEALLQSQSESYDFVSSRTSSLKEACENLLAEQEALGKLADEVRERLAVFDLLEPAVKLLSTGGEGVCLQEGFVEMLGKLDGALEFVSQHLRYKDAELYMMKFRQCMTRGLTLVKMHFVSAMRILVTDIQVRIADRQQSSAAGDALPKSLQTSLFYIKFKSQLAALKPLIEEIEKRCEGHREYLGLLGECTGSYFAARKALLGPIIISEILNLAEGKDMLSIAKDGAAYVLSVCTDECALYYQFFTLGQEDFGRYLESLCSALYDHLRPMILREQQINTITELCRTLQVHLDTVDAFNPEPFELETSISDMELPPSAVDGSPVSPTMDGQWKNSGFDAASAKVAVERILQDAQERLAFRAQGFIKSEIEGFKPSERELDVLARSEKLPLPSVLSQPNMVPDLGASQASALMAEMEGAIDQGNDGFIEQPLVLGKIVYGSGEWYPTLQKTLYILGKMYRALPYVFLSSFAYNADVLKSKIDGQFFLIKNLLMLREQIAPFDSNFVRREEVLDFSNVSDVVSAVLKSGWDFSRIASIGFGFVSSNPLAVPRVIETFNDARRAVSDELRKVCEAMILETAKGAMDPVASFMIKATAFKLKQERDARQAHSGALERLGLQSFASPQNCVAVSNNLKATITEKVALSVNKMQDYIGDPKTEDVLIYHIKTNIVETYTVFYNTVTGEHDHRVLQGFMSEKDVTALIDEAVMKGKRKEAQPVETK